MTVFIKIGANKYNAADYQIPAERTFRNAWDNPPEGSDVIGVDMGKARDIWRDKIRAARVPEFEALDAAFMKSLETGDNVKKAEVTSKKQKLRDATADPAIDAATTPEELKLVQPAGLKVE